MSRQYDEEEPQRQQRYEPLLSGQHKQGPAQSKPAAPSNGGRVFDKKKQEGSVLHVVQQGYSDRNGPRNTAQYRVVLKQYEGHDYVSIEKWKVDEGKDGSRIEDYSRQGACSVTIKYLRELASAIVEAANSLDGGDVL